LKAQADAVLDDIDDAIANPPGR